MCVSVRIFMSLLCFIVHLVLLCFFLLLICLSVCLSVSCLCLWALLPDLNKMMMMMMLTTVTHQKECFKVNMNLCVQHPDNK